MGEEPIDKRTYRPKTIAEAGAPVGQSAIGPLEAALESEVQEVIRRFSVTEAQARSFVQSAKSHLEKSGAFGPGTLELTSPMNPPISMVGPPIIPEVAPPKVPDVKAWYDTLKVEEQLLLDKILESSTMGLYLVEAFSEPGVPGSQGSSYLQMLNGQQIQVPFPIGGVFGRYAVLPFVQPVLGAMPTGTVSNGGDTVISFEDGAEVTLTYEFDLIEIGTVPPGFKWILTLLEIAGTPQGGGFLSWDLWCQTGLEGPAAPSIPVVGDSIQGSIGFWAVGNVGPKGSNASQLATVKYIPITQPLTFYPGQKVSIGAGATAQVTFINALWVIEQVPL